MEDKRGEPRFRTDQKFSDFNSYVTQSGFDQDALQTINLVTHAVNHLVFQSSIASEAEAMQIFQPAPYGSPPGGNRGLGAVSEESSNLLRNYRLYFLQEAGSGRNAAGSSGFKREKDQP